MSPDRVVVLDEWVRWKHRFTLAVLAVVVTSVISMMIGLLSLFLTFRESTHNVTRNTRLICSIYGIFDGIGDLVGTGPQAQAFVVELQRVVDRELSDDVTEELNVLCVDQIGAAP